VNWGEVHGAALEIRAEGEQLVGTGGGWGIESVDGFSERLVELVGSIVAVTMCNLVEVHDYS